MSVVRAERFCVQASPDSVKECLCVDNSMWKCDGEREMQLELYTVSVFFGRYQLVFLGKYHTNTEGKLGQYFQYHRYKKVRMYSKLEGQIA